MFLVSGMMGDGCRGDVVDECDVVDAAEGYAGSHFTPGTARLVLGSCHAERSGGGMFTVCSMELDKETIGRWGAERRKRLKG